ncbi:MAG: ArsR/SmtB family transcription factor [Micromonosporaceae bacterium]
MRPQSRQGTVPAPAACCPPLIAESLDVARSSEIAKVFKALGDPVRVRLLSRIASAPGETCVCDLTDGFDVSGPTISHHLKTLREAGLVDCERRGTWVYYRVIPERMAWLSALLAAPGLHATAEHTQMEGAGRG